jgi:hypothetical protein
MHRQEQDHPFKVYLRKKRLSQTWAKEKAKELGESLSQGHLSDLLNGKEHCTLRVARLIEKISDGDVSAERILRWHLEQMQAEPPKRKAS